MNLLATIASKPGARRQARLVRRQALTSSLFLSLFLAACGGGNPGGTQNTNQPPAPPPAVTVSGNCANPYYPVSSTTRREYEVTYMGGDMKPVSYTESYSDITPEAFKQVTSLAGGSTITHAWKCAGEGLAALDYAQLNFGNQSQGGMKMDIDTINAEGVMIPAAANWRVGHKWKTRFDLSGKIESPGAPAPGDMKSTVLLDHEIVGEEAVTVAAGTFNAFKVVTKLTQTGTMNMGGGSGPSTMNIPLNTALTMTLYHARDVGLVKSVIDRMATTELRALTK